MNKPPLEKKRDWLEPPDWWKQWRPLRWLAGLVMVIAVLSWLQPLFAPDDSAWVEEPVRPPPRSTVVAESSAAGADQGEPKSGEHPALAVEAAAKESAPATIAPPPAATAQARGAEDPSSKVPAAEVAAAPTQPTPPPVAATAVPDAAPAAVAPEPAPAVTEEADVVTAPPPAAEIEADAELATLEAQETRDYRAFTERLPNPVRLIAQFDSYSSVDRVFTSLVAENYAPVQESNHAKVRSGVPPRDLDLLRVKAYRHLGVEGTLELLFFNDRLYQTDFEPGNAEAYQSALRKAVPQLPRERSGRSEYSEGPLRVASSVDLAVSEVGAALRTRPFVLWQDTRLIEQRDTWDKRFSAKP